MKVRSQGSLGLDSAHYQLGNWRDCIPISDISVNPAVRIGRLAAARPSCSACSPMYGSGHQGAILRDFG